jgi:hypothetical protein
VTEYLLDNWQTPTNRGLVIIKGEVRILSECCSAIIETDRDRNFLAFCTACSETIMGHSEFSCSFPVAAFKMERVHNYWWSWGLYWFGLEEFSFEVEW